MTDDKTRQLENRIDELEETIQKMMPSRRDALKMGGAALVGGAAMSGTASAGTNQVGTIGSASQPVDLESEDINNADTITTDTLDSTTQNNSGTVTTQDLVVNGTATGPFGGGIVLEAGDTITVETIARSDVDRAFLTLYTGSAKDLLGGIALGSNAIDFKYTFSDSSTLNKSGGGNYDFNNFSDADDTGGERIEVDFFPPAKDVTKIEVGATKQVDSEFAAEVIFKD